MAQYIPPQIDYTSRDFDSLRADLVTLVRERVPGWTGDDPSDFAVTMIDAFAYMGDTMSYYIDRAANESSLANATKIQTLLDMASLFGYRPSGPTPAQVQLRFTNVSNASVDIPVGTQISAPLALGPYSEVYFEVIQSATAVGAGASVTLAAVEGKTVNTDVPGQIVNNKALPTRIGTSNGTSNQEFLLNEVGIVDGSVKVYVGQGASFTAWQFVENTVEYGPYDQVFTTKQTSTGKLTVVFGDGVNGAIPASGELVSATFRSSVGVAGNVSAESPNMRVTFIPGLEQTLINSLKVTNPSAATGGADGDNILTLRTKLTKSISARRRAVTADDYESLATNVSNVGQAKLIATSPANVTLRMQPINDGSATPGIESGVPSKQWYSTAAALVKYFSDKTPIGTTVAVLPPVYVPIALTLNVTVKPQYRNRDVKLAVAQQLVSGNFGLFAYGNFKFGSDVYLSDIITTVANLDSVESVSVTQLQRSAFITDASKVSSTLVFTAYHAFNVGDVVTVTGVDPTDFNRTGTISAVTTNTFTFTPTVAVSGTPTFSLGGLAVVGSASANVSIADHELAYLPNTNLTISATGGLI